MSDANPDETLQQLENAYVDLINLENVIRENAERMGVSPYRAQYMDGKLMLTDVIVAKAQLLAVMVPLRQAKESRDTFSSLSQKVVDWAEGLGEKQ